MATLEILGKQLEVDSDGNLSDLNDWNKNIAIEIAKIEGIPELTERHWMVIDFMRERCTYKRTVCIISKRSCKKSSTDSRYPETKGLRLIKFK